VKIYDRLVLPSGSEQSIILVQRHTSTCTESSGRYWDEDIAQGAPLASHIIASMDRSYQYRVFTDSTLADKRTCRLTECISYQELNGGVSSAPPKLPANLGRLPRGALPQCDLMLPLATTQPHARTDLHASIPFCFDFVRSNPQYTTLTNLDDFVDNPRSWQSPGVIHYPQVSADNMIPTLEEVEHEYLGVMWQPLQDYPTGPPNTDPWSALVNHPTSTAQLVLSHRPYHKGYDSIPKPEDVIANVESIIQRADITTRHGKSNDALTNGYAESSLSSEGEYLMFPEIVTPTSSQPASNSGAVSLSDQRPMDQLRAESPFPQSALVNWNSKTGEPLTKLRMKRRQSEGEKASSQEVRRRGGPCTPCRLGHRKVIFSTATVLHLY